MTSPADALAALVFPQGCHVCGGPVLRRADGVACSACWSALRELDSERGRATCGRCGAPGTGRCDPCAPEGVTAMRSVGPYAGALRAVLLDLKRRPIVCRRLATRLARTFRESEAFATVDMVVPVPLHADRLAERGHNQARILASALVRGCDGVELSEHALLRVRPTAERRAGFGRAARAEAVRRAFRAAPRLVTGRRVLLVDDLVTTGATLAACARALRAAGALDVFALTAARTSLLA